MPLCFFRNSSGTNFFNRREIRSEFLFRAFSQAEIVHTWILSLPRNPTRIILCQALNLVALH